MCQARSHILPDPPSYFADNFLQITVEIFIADLVIPMDINKCHSQHVSVTSIDLFWQESRDGPGFRAIL